MCNDNRPPVPHPDSDATAWAPTEVAGELKISLRHLNNLRREDTSFPAPIMLGRCPRWYPSHIRDYVRGQRPSRGKGRIK